MTSQTEHATRNPAVARLGARYLRVNPIIIKEVRAQMRGPRAFLILTGYLVVLGLLAYGLYRVTLIAASQRYGSTTPLQTAYIGQALFIGLAFLELLFVCFITPALTAGAISGEYERGTYDMLLATPLRPAAILWGKLLPAMTYVLLLILAAIPLFSIVFIFGGVVIRDLIQTVGLLGLTGLAYGSLGIFFSALTRRTGRATVLTYLVVITLIFGSFFIWLVTGAIYNQTPPLQVLYVNPLSALASGIMTPEISSDYYGYGGFSSFTGLLSLLSGGPTILGTATGQIIARPLWQYTAALYLALTALLQLLTIQLVKPVRRWRIGWRGLMATLLVLALIAAGLYVAFGTRLGSTGWQALGAPTPEGVILFAPTPVPGAVMPVMTATPWDLSGLPTPTPPPTALALTPTPDLLPETPFPTPTPTPTPVPFTPFDTTTALPWIADYLALNLLPLETPAFCDVEVLSSEPQKTEAQLYLWAYCRAYSVQEGALVPGLGFSAPVGVIASWSPDQGWHVRGHWTGSVRDLLSPGLQLQVQQRPYDEVAGEARLRERAEQSDLLGVPPATVSSP